MSLASDPTMLLVLILVCARFSVIASWQKCCTGNTTLKKLDNYYTCSESVNVTIRTQIVPKIDLDLDQKFCVDFDEEIGLFDFTGSELIKVQGLDVDIFPKCCPLNYLYNSTTHGCVKSSNLDVFFNEEFVQVGLPQCVIIQDFKLGQDESLELSQLNQIYKKGKYCVDKDTNFTGIVRKCLDDLDVCDSVKCVHQCCPDGQSFINGSKCQDTYINGLDFTTLKSNMDNIKDDFVIVHGYNSPIYYLHPPGRFQFHLDQNGIFSMSELDMSVGKINITREYTVEEYAYCVEHALTSQLNTFLFFRGVSNTVQTKFWYTGTAMVISCISLILTIIYYCISSQKRTTFGKILISYCTVALLGFSILASLVFVKKPTTQACTVLMFFILYSTLSMFTWMNVMCIDIYRTFGSPKSFLTRQDKSRELKKFLFYSMYGWGAPLVLILLAIILQKLDVLPTYAQIILDPNKCFIYRGKGHYAQLFFSTIPIAIIGICNLVLFIKTAMYCFKVKKEISVMNDTNKKTGEKRRKFENFKDRFGLLLKLFLIMGVSFLFEVLSSFLNFKKNNATAVIETIWDTVNSLQGFFIFVIFILKKKTFKKRVREVDSTRLREFSQRSSGVTQTTSLINSGDQKE